MGTPLEYAMGTIRLSVGRFTTAREVDDAAAAIIDVVSRLQPRDTVDVAPAAADEIKLTRYTHGLGCACKLQPRLLREVLATMSASTDTSVMIDGSTADDAAVYRISDELAIVQTVDFFTPIVDDPCQFGAIAAANSLSDIYAMGARPIFAVSVVGFPSNRLPIEVLSRILRGAEVKAAEAGISILGGHTIDDTEPKFGLAVTGVIDPDKILANSNCRPGDILILTKPIGTGILTTALKQGRLDREDQTALEQSMAALNADAAAAMQTVGVHSCTDVTGFGLLGHLLEMMNGSDTTAIVEAKAVPLLPGASDAAAAGVIPGGTLNNETYTADSVTYDDRVSSVTRALLNDAQTSGGLLIAVPTDSEATLLAELTNHGVRDAATIGKVVSSEDKRITVL
jgi:selenium donor protein